MASTKNQVDKLKVEQEPAPGSRAWTAMDGAAAPLGVHWVEAEQAYNFAIYSKGATKVTLLLYAEHDLLKPCYQRELNYLQNRTGRVWHCRVPNAEAGQATYYGYRLDGPNDPSSGQRFDPQKILLDPYAQAVFFPPAFSRAASCRPGSNAGAAPLGVLLAGNLQPEFDWGSDPRPHHTHDTVIYELHVKGFTEHPSSGVAADRRGTFAGLIEKIPYLKELGVTVVELLPVHQYDPQEGNYWGYMTLNFFAPHHLYGCTHDPHDLANEFRAMVKALHEAGIELILDVVYNHTTEGDQNGPTYSYRGIDNQTYYLLEPDRVHYRNDTGTGNTLRCAHPTVRKLIIDSMRFWVEEMHVDGFRFDLASIFTRDERGDVDLDSPPIISEISADPHFAHLRLIAEAWDISSYQLGAGFPGISWFQWNGKFRDDVRGFVRGDWGKLPDLMSRIYGSCDLFPDTMPDVYHPYQSINFITAHDGFCLYDLVSYNHKHNEANGHGNTDGSDFNLSWNCGWEGDDGVPPEVLELRKRQIKNFAALLFLSNGTPMFCAGDEFMNTQRGNNNPYNQDNEITWLNWDRLEQNRDMFRFFQQLIAFRKAHPSLGRNHYWREDVRWYGASGPLELGEQAQTLGVYISGRSVQDCDIYLMINASPSDVEFTIQEGLAAEQAGAKRGRKQAQPSGWLRVVDTSQPSPDDVRVPGEELALTGERYLVRSRSVVVLKTSS